MTVSKYVPIGQHICFLIAILANSLLLYLIKIRAGTAFGRYRIMMICFSVYSIFYATVETLTLPVKWLRRFIKLYKFQVLHIQGSGILFYVNSVLKENVKWGVVIISEFDFFLNSRYIVFFQHYTAAHLHFVSQHWPLIVFIDILRFVGKWKLLHEGLLRDYRSTKLYYFDGYKLYLWFLPPLVMFGAWATTIIFIYVPNPETRDFFRNMTREVYEENIDQIAYVGPVYYVSWL